jgi:hypothetical protein
MAGQSLNLLIVHTYGEEDISDWLEIKRRIEEPAPDIEVRIAVNGAGNSVTRRWQVTRPSLVFSACRLWNFRPKGGTVYAGRRFTKIEQVERLAGKGLPVPRSTQLTRDIVLDPLLWGRYVIAKPLVGQSGYGVRLVPTRDVAARFAELTRDGKIEMAIQTYIEHTEDDFPTEYRVLTMFGTVLYAARNRWGKPRRSLEQIASDPNGIIASNSKEYGRERQVWNDPEIIALGERAHSAFPEVAVLGVDVLRETNTGRLYVLETNPGGFTWHLSSGLAEKTFAPEHIRAIYQQFDALERAAQLLIEKTRAEAR